jgi:hypothetical protein
MDKYERKMIEVVNRNHNLKVIEAQANAFAERLNAISARRNKKGAKR